MRPYRVALIQQETVVIVDPRKRDDIIQKNLNRIFELLDFTAARLGMVKLAAFSEYGIIGQFRPRSVDEWLALAETIPGDVTTTIGKKARQLGCFISGNLYERDEKWPGRLFNTSFIVSPEEKVILKYRKQNGPNNLNTIYTGPGDVYSEYIAKHGKESFFPVADTEIGRLACLSCTDIVFPEVARALALNGAEVMIHPTAEPYAVDSEAWDAMRKARAYENFAYFLSINAGAFLGSNRPVAGYRGKTQIVTPLGRVEAIAEAPGEAVVTGDLDIDRLRLERTRMAESGHIWNSLIELRSDMFAEIYATAKRWPNDHWKDKLLQSTKETRSLAGQIIDRLVAEGRLVRPDSDLSRLVMPVNTRYAPTKFSYPFVPVCDRGKLTFPKGKRLAVIFTLNLEYWELTRDQQQEPLFPGGPMTLPHSLPGHTPDYTNWTWREYGQRVGVWRVIDLLDRYKLPASCTFNAVTALHRRRIIDAALERNWELVGHNYAQNDLLSYYAQKPNEERALIERTLAVFKDVAGKPCKAWLSSALRGTDETPGILKQNGLIAVSDFLNDDQPYLIHTEHGPIVCVPYSNDVNDFAMFARGGKTPTQGLETLTLCFKQLYAESAASGRIMNFGLHPHVIGQPHNIFALDQFLKQLQDYSDIWYPTREELAQWYLGQAEAHIPSTPKR